MPGTSIYAQIVAMRSDADAQRRGYRFEQALREVMPWSLRPPLAVSAESEQLDAFFEWNSWHFLVEAKAKSHEIQRGSHDWEDFELKVRKRGATCIGLFCSLFSVSSGIIQAATELNRSGHCILILHGSVWDDLVSDPIPFESLLKYLVYRARSTARPEPESLGKVRAFLYDRDQTKRRVHGVCRNVSATFLRRHKHPRHADLYVPREIDRYIKNLALALNPSRLSLTRKSKAAGERTIEHERARPVQILIIRDSSGAGKTTLAANVALGQSAYFGITRTANERDIDNLDAILARIGENNGIDELIAADQPVVYFIDSLDEAPTGIVKRKEINSLLKLSDELNDSAKSLSLISFPLALVFSVRDDFWRDWETCFEGRPVRSFVNRFSQFTPPELEAAIDHYSSVYNYKLLTISDDARKILAVPFNLQVFSEAHEYEGTLDSGEIFEENVLSLFFTRKIENIAKRDIAGLYEELILRHCAAIAIACAEREEDHLKRTEVLDLLEDECSLPLASIQKFVLAICSDQIVFSDVDRPNDIHFRHTRFIEYLAAYYMVMEVAGTESTNSLSRRTENIFKCPFLSMFRVHEYIRFIAKNSFPAVNSMIQEFYSRSNSFVGPLALRLRSRMAEGKTIPDEDLDVLARSADTSAPNVAWDSFFVMCGKQNAQPNPVVASFFELAWKANHGRPDRWKMLDKMAARGLLLSEGVLLRVLESTEPREWEEFLGLVLRYGLEVEFRTIGMQELGSRLGGEDEWRVVRGLLHCIENEVTYIPGSLG